jgi:protein-disulfide isomerase
MSRLSLVLVALVGVLAGALGYAVVSRPQPLEPAAVQALIDKALSEYEGQRLATTAAQPPSVSADQINPLIESYLMSDPKILQRMSVALETTLRREEQAQSRSAIASMQNAIYNAPGQVVLGNPEGDVTLVEFFDYNCGYCRNALPDLAALLAEDPNLRVVLKEFPILSNESIDAARVGVLVGQSDADYWAFHEALFTARGQVNKDVAPVSYTHLTLPTKRIV